MKNKGILVKSFLLFIFIIILSNYKVYAKSLAELERDYPTGSVWQGGGECAGFASTMYEQFYGIKPGTYRKKVETKDLSQIQAGDVVRYTGNMGHSVWIASRNGDTVRLAEANYDLKNGIRWRTASIYEFSNLNYIYKAPYVLGQNPPTLSAPKNIKAEVEKNKGVKVSWDAVDGAAQYVVKIYRKSDVDKSNFSNPVYSKELNRAYNQIYANINEQGEFYAFVHTKIGYNVSPNGGNPSLFSIKLISSISISTLSKEMIVGETMKIQTSYLPLDANNTNITISSSNTDIATYSERSGYITAKKAGTVTIYAKSNNNITASITITVKDGIKVNSFQLNSYRKTMKVGQKFKLEVRNIVPENATNKNAIFESYDSSIVSVDSNGNVTALKVGETYVRVYMGSTSISCRFTVEAGIDVSSISLNKNNIEMKVGEKEKLITKITPSNATNKNVTWNTSNSNIATISLDGTITAKSAGTVVITAKCGNYTATCNLKIYEAYFVNEYKNLPKSNIFDLDIEKYEAKLDNGKTAKVSVTSNNPCVMVGGSHIYGEKGGFATVTGYDDNYGTFTAVCFVNDTVKLKDGTYQFPGDLNNNYKFDSSDVTLLRKIINEGNLSEDNQKLCDINGDGKYDNSDVELLNKIVTEKLITINEIEISYVKAEKSIIDLGNKKIHFINSLIYPSNTTQSKIVTYTSSDNSIATVDSNGEITVLKPGKVTITVTTCNGKKDSLTYEFTQSDLNQSESYVYTTLPVHEVHTQETITFVAQKCINTFMNSTAFPILDNKHTVSIIDNFGNIKNNSSIIGSKNIIQIKNPSGDVVKKYIAIIRGDITGDGYVRMYDSFEILKGAVAGNKGLDEIDYLIRDYNQDGNIRMYDAFQYLREAVSGK